MSVILILISIVSNPNFIPANWQKAEKKFLYAEILQVRSRAAGELNLLVETKKGKIELNIPQIFDLPRCRAGNYIRGLIKIYPLSPGFNSHRGLYDYLLFRRGVVARAWTVDDYTCIGNEIEPPLRLEIFNKLKDDFGDSEVLSLLVAMNLGAGEVLSEGAKGLFKDLGLSHVLVVSGFHVGLVYALCFYIFDYLFSRSIRLINYVPSEFIAIPFALSGATFFCFLSGAAIPSLRALIFLFVTVFFKIIGSAAGSLHRLAFTFCLILIFNRTALFDISLLLSIAAVIGVILGLQVDKFSSIAISIFAWLFTFPICLFFFGQVVVLAPLINIILLPFITFTFSIIGMIELIIGLLKIKHLFTVVMVVLNFIYDLLWQIHEYFRLDVISLEFYLSVKIAIFFVVFDAIIFIYFYKYRLKKNDVFLQLAKA